MTNYEFVSILKDIAEQFKTCYMLGCFGAPTNQTMIDRALKRTDVNNKPYKQGALSIKNQGFMFDCVCLIKGVLWGWNGNINSTYGGAKYASNGVPDISADGMINICKNISTNFNNIKIGEAVWIKGHIGVYVGDGKVIECTPKWSVVPGVKYSWVENLGFKGSMSRTWVKHGMLPWVNYITEEDKKGVKDDIGNTKRYNKIEELPDWAKEPIKYYVDNHFLNGIGNDNLDLSVDMVRILVIIYKTNLKKG